MNEIIRESQEIMSAIMQLKTRAKSSNQLDMPIAKIWAISRENKESLDAMRFRKMIKQVIIDAVSRIQREWELSEGRLAEEKISHRETRRQLKEALSRVDVLERASAAHERQSSKQKGKPINKF